MPAGIRIPQTDEVIMDYSIEYTCLCDKGNTRKENQDNFFCAGKYLNAHNNGLEKPLTGLCTATQSPVFSVFDGISGEQCGETAAYIAAVTLDECLDRRKKTNTIGFLVFACKEINSKICDFVRKNNIFRMGTTAAMVMFKETSSIICNLGDSRVYRFNGNSLTQLSKDHVAIDYSYGGKPLLTQNLGIPKEEFVIEPYIAEGALQSGDIFLICSDGLTNMVSEADIQSILAQSGTTLDGAKKLLSAALHNGGKDNITIILCKTCFQPYN